MQTRRTRRVLPELLALSGWRVRPSPFSTRTHDGRVCSIKTLIFCSVLKRCSCSTDPRTILRCLRLPSAPASRHLNSQTSGPLCRSARITLPFCIDFLSASCALGLILHEGTIQAQILVQARQEYAINLGEGQGGYCFAAEITGKSELGQQCQSNKVTVEIGP